MAKKNSKKIEKPKEIIHIKLEYDEKIKGRESVLSSQANLLRTLKHIGNYKKLRNTEAQKKTRIATKVKEIKTLINQLNTILPKYNLPEILKKEDKEDIPVEEIKENYERKKIYSSVDKQLEEIQRKLRIIQEK